MNNEHDNTEPQPAGTGPTAIDPALLSLTELRELRSALQREDDTVSYARRVAQARLDLVEYEVARRAGTGSELTSVDAELRDVLSRHLTGGPARPPRPAEDLSDDHLSRELDELCSRHGFGQLEQLDDERLSTLRLAIAEFEQRVSADRRARFDKLDALSSELVRRYRDGEADVDTLLAD